MERAKTVRGLAKMYLSALATEVLATDDCNDEERRDLEKLEADDDQGESDNEDEASGEGEKDAGNKPPPKNTGGTRGQSQTKPGKVTKPTKGSDDSLNRFVVDDGTVAVRLFIPRRCLVNSDFAFSFL